MMMMRTRSWATSATVLALTLTSAIAVKSLGNWMAIGLQGYSVVNQPEQYLLSNVGTTSPLCNRIKGLSAGQEKLCMLYTDHMIHVEEEPGAGSGSVSTSSGTGGGTV